MPRTSLHLLAALSAVGLATSAMAQTRVSLPMVGLTSHRTITPGPLSPRPSSGFVQAPVTGVVQGGKAPVVITGGGHGFVSRGVISSGSGLRVSGEFNDDNFRLRFNLGSDFGHGHIVHHTRGPVVVPWGGSPWYHGDPCYRGGRRSNQYYVIDGALVHGYQPPPAPPPPQAEPPPPPTKMELAAAYLRADQPEQARAMLQEHLTENADDADAMRAMAIALLRSGEFTQGIAVMALAYQTNPALCERPMRAGELWDSETDLRRDLVRLVTFTHRNPSGSAFLSIAALMQAQGRDDHAVRMATRARTEGLEVELADRMIAALTRP